MQIPRENYANDTTVQPTGGILFSSPFLWLLTNGVPQAKIKALQQVKQRFLDLVIITLKETTFDLNSCLLDQKAIRKTVAK